MTVEVAVSEVIERHIEMVAAFVVDPSNIRRWVKQVAAAEWTTDPPVRLGSRVRFRRTGRAGSTVDDYEICEYDLGHQVALRSVDTTPTTTVTYTWRPVSDRVTHMTLRTRIDTTTRPGPIESIQRIVVRRSTTRDLRALKRILETS